MSNGSCAIVVALCEPQGADSLINRVTVSYASSHLGATVQMTSFKVSSSEYTDDFMGTTIPEGHGELLIVPAHKPEQFQGILDFSIPLSYTESVTEGWIAIKEVKLVTSPESPHGKYVFGKTRKVNLFCHQL